MDARVALEALDRIPSIKGLVFLKSHRSHTLLILGLEKMAGMSLDKTLLTPEAF